MRAGHRWGNATQSPSGDAVAADNLVCFYFICFTPFTFMMRKRMFTDLYRITMWKNRPTAI